MLSCCYVVRLGFIPRVETVSARFPRGICRLVGNESETPTCAASNWRDTYVYIVYALRVRFPRERLENETNSLDLDIDTRVRWINVQLNVHLAQQLHRVLRRSREHADHSSFTGVFRRLSDIYRSSGARRSGNARCLNAVPLFSSSLSFPFCPRR